MQTTSKPIELDSKKIPDEEQVAFAHIADLLTILSVYEIQFRLAVMLFYAVEQEYNNLSRDVIQAGLMKGNFASDDLRNLTLLSPARFGWQKIAARDGAISIYHFGCVLDGIKASLPTCPTVNAHVDHGIIRLARKDYRRAFPHYERIRHVVAHSADFISTTKNRERHSRRGAFKAKAGTVGVEINDDQRVTQFSGNLYGNSYFITYDGEAYGYALSQDSADTMQIAKDRVYSAFGDAVIVKPEA